MKLLNMNKSNILKIQSALLLLAVTFTLLAPVSAFADIKSDVCSGVGLSSDGTCQGAEKETKSVNSVVALGLNLFTAIVGVIAVVMIIISGVKYMTSQGDPEKLLKLKIQYCMHVLVWLLLLLLKL
jgi:hypothetical protein